MVTHGRRAGVSLLEILIALAILAIAMLALMSTLFSSSTLRDITREKVLAYEAARLQLETMRNLSLTEVNGALQAQPATLQTIFPNYSPGGVPGPFFNVAGLNPVPGSANVGTITFPTTAYVIGTGPQPGGTLSEAVTDARWAMPRDLDGDGLMNSTNVNATYRLLPVRITITWLSLNGPTTITVNSLLTSK